MLRNNNDPISAPPTPPPPPPASQRKGFHFSLFGLGSSSPSSSSSPPPPHPSASTNPIPSPQSSGSSHSSHEHASLAPAQSGQTLWPSDTAHPPDGADRSASASASALTSTSPSSSTSHGSSSSGGEGGGVRRTPSLVSRISRASSTQFGAQFKSLFRSASSRGLKHSASSAAISPVPATAAAAPTATFIHPAHVSAPDHHGGDHFADAMGSYGSPPPAPVAATRELYAPQPVKATGKRWSVADLRAAVTDIEASSETGLNTSYDSAAREHDDLHRHAAAHRDAMAASPSSPSRFLASRKSVLDLFSGNNATPPPPSDGMNPLLTAISETPPASEGSLGEPLASIPVTIADTLVLGSAPPMAEGHAPHHTGSYKKSGARPAPLVLSKAINAGTTTAAALMSPTHVAYLQSADMASRHDGSRNSVPSAVGASAAPRRAVDPVAYRQHMYSLDRQLAGSGHHAPAASADQRPSANGMHDASPSSSGVIGSGGMHGRPVEAIRILGSQTPPMASRSLTDTHGAGQQQLQHQQQQQHQLQHGPQTSKGHHYPSPSGPHAIPAHPGVAPIVTAVHPAAAAPTSPHPKSPVQTMLERYRLLPAFEEKYQVGDELGSGGFGFVVTATRRSDGAEVAVKFIFKEKVVVQALTNDPDFGVVPMEVHVIKKLHHPNIIGFLDFFTDNRFYYLVMELHGVPWQKGVDLNTLRLKSASQPPALHRSYSEPSPRVPVIGRRHSMDLFECIEANSRLSENVAQKIFSQVASAVEHLLDHNIVHRDIKDENLVVDAHFNVKLIDFGSALHIPTNGRLFERFAGTLQYCPPEVIQGNKYRGPEQEVWALGILLYTILFSGAPFANVNQVLNNDLPIPKHSRGPMAGKPRASEEVVHLLRWMLRKNPSERAGIKDIMAHPWLSIRFTASTSSSHRTAAEQHDAGAQEAAGATESAIPLASEPILPSPPLSSHEHAAAAAAGKHHAMSPTSGSRKESEDANPLPATTRHMSQPSPYSVVRGPSQVGASRGSSGGSGSGLRRAGQAGSNLRELFATGTAEQQQQQQQQQQQPTALHPSSAAYGKPSHPLAQSMVLVDSPGTSPMPSPVVGKPRTAMGVDTAAI